ncbi:MAG TPA: glutathione binding-like protein, partial [Candidatus Binataceae bacterium]|nr:glutathione binding-like protein [Candidatus Binataceae bacterium]
EYVQWMHYAEGSAMLPLMMLLYVMMLGDAGKPLHPRIESELANHLGYIDSALKGREFLVGDRLTGADIQMSFIAEVAGAFGKRGAYPNLDAWIKRLHQRPAYQAALQKGGTYNLAV